MTSHHAAGFAASPRPHVATPLRPQSCPMCRSQLLAPEATVFQEAGRVHGQVHHLWSCDDCGYAFCTEVDVRPGRMTAKRI
jgi:hypothetical protein